MNAVGGDHDLGGDREVALAAASSVAMQARAASRQGLDPRRVRAEGESVVAEALHRGTQQEVLQLPAVNGDLRPAIAGREATRLRPDRLTVLAVVAELLAADASALERALQPELEQLAHRVRKHVDADAEGLHSRHRFDDPDAKALLVQAERRREPADARPHDHDLCIHAPSFRGGDCILAPPDFYLGEPRDGLFSSPCLAALATRCSPPLAR